MNSLTSYLHLPIEDPTWIFFLVLLIILLAPMVFSKLRIPHIVGMILAGVLIGEHGLHLLNRDASFQLFGQVGIFYIMFLAGLEMDLEGFKHNVSKGLLFGSLTTLIPFGCGFLAGYFLLDYSVGTSLLLACIFASHTIVAYPIVARYGLARHPAVTISIAGTMCALLFSLIFLAIISTTYRGGGNVWFWVLFALKCVAYFVGMFLIFPPIIRQFFKRYTERVVQYIFVLAMMFFAAVMAELCGIEGLLGAFIAGLVFNRFIPHSSSLMNRIEFVGNALFIPYFLVGVGMMVNLGPLFSQMGAVGVVVIIVLVSTLSKLLASSIARKLLGFNHAQGLVMFGLSEAHAAGAIAMVMVGTSLVVDEATGDTLMPSAVLDGVVVMILISCIISSIVTDQGARRMKLQQDGSQDLGTDKPTDDEKILVLLKDTSRIRNITQTAIMMRNPRLNRGLICLNVVNDSDFTDLSARQSREVLSQAEEICAAADIPVQTQSRLAVNIVNGVVHSMRENDASEILIGLHEKVNGDMSLYGHFAQELIKTMNRQLIIVDYSMPVNTIRRVVVAVPERAEYEVGFYRWVTRLARLVAEIGCRVEFHTAEATGKLIHRYMNAYHKNVRCEFHLSDSALPQEVGRIADDINPDHLLVVVTARPGGISYQKGYNRIAEIVQERVLRRCNVMMIFPDQYGENNEEYTFTEPLKVQYDESKVTAWLSKWISKVG